MNILLKQLILVRLLLEFIMDSRTRELSPVVAFGLEKLKEDSCKSDEVSDLNISLGIYPLSDDEYMHGTRELPIEPRNESISPSRFNSELGYQSPESPARLELSRQQVRRSLSESIADFGADVLGYAEDMITKEKDRPK